MTATAWRIDEPLRTPRLELRVHRMTDLDDLIVFHSDPDVTRYIPWPVRTRDQVRDALETKLSKGSATAAGEWIVLAIVLAESSTVIGEVLLKRVDDAGTEAEVGYVIRADAQGKGLASEAVGGILQWARELGVRSVTAIVVDENDASSRLLLRQGFERDETLDHTEDDVRLEGFRLALA